jgi:hypothetical protein
MHSRCIPSICAESFADSLNRVRTLDDTRRLQLLLRFHNDDHTSPIVLSAAELLEDCRFEGRLDGLLKSVMVKLGLPVVMLQAHPDVPSHKKQAHTLFTLQCEHAGEILLAAEHTRRGTSEASQNVLD